jgi:hypothetical protein
MEEESNGKTSHVDTTAVTAGKAVKTAVPSTAQRQNMDADVTDNGCSGISEEELKTEIVEGAKDKVSTNDSCLEPDYAGAVNSSSLGIA